MKTSILPLAFLMLCALVLNGCETQSATQAAVSVTPRTAQVRKGESVGLTASGWHEYQWELENPTWGYLSARKGANVTYTALLSAEQIGGSTNNPAQVLTQRVVVYATGTASNASAAAPIDSVEAFIEHR